MQCELSSVNILYWNILFWTGCLQPFLPMAAQCATKAPTWAVSMLLTGGKNMDQGISWGPCPWLRASLEKYVWGWSTKRQGKKVRAQWALNVKLQVREKDWKWVLINDSKCSAEWFYTAKQKKDTQNWSGRGRDITHTNKLDGSLRREVKPL